MMTPAYQQQHCHPQAATYAQFIVIMVSILYKLSNLKIAEEFKSKH